jgi:hypothetical protein
VSLGYTKIVWPDIITRGCAWNRALGAVAPGITAQILGYRDDANKSDLMELATIAATDLRIDRDELLRTAWRLTGELVRDPCVWAVSSLQCGRARYSHARVVIERGETIPPTSEPGNEFKYKRWSITTH